MDSRRQLGRRNDLSRQISRSEGKRKSQQNVENDKHLDNEKRKASASVDEIRDLYSALQTLVPGQDRSPPSPASHQLIPEEPGTRAVNQKGSAVESSESMEELDSISSSSRLSLEPPFPLRQRSSSPLPSRTQPKIISRNRSSSLIAFSTESTVESSHNEHTSKRVPKKSQKQTALQRSSSPLPAKTQPAMIVGRSRSRSLVALSDTSGLSEKSRKIDEELTKLISNFDQSKREKENGKINYLTSKRRLSAGNALEKRSERLKDPQQSYRRRSIGGSLLLNAIVNSQSPKSSSRMGSLTRALNLIARKGELQDLLRNCQEKILQEGVVTEGGVERLDETDGKERGEIGLHRAESYEERKMERLLQSILKQQQDTGDCNVDRASSDDSDLIRRGSVGTEMHNLLEALRELVLPGDNTSTVSTPSASALSSRRTSLSDRTLVPSQKESLDELEAFFKNKLQNISEREIEQKSKSRAKPIDERGETAVKTPSKETLNSEDDGRTNKRGISERNEEKVRKANESLIHRSQSTVELLKPSFDFEMTIEENLSTKQEPDRNLISRRTRSRSAYGLELEAPRAVYEGKINSRSANVSSRSRRRNNDSIDGETDEALSRALWKEDQEVFAKQVNQRLHDWLERATAMSQQQEDDSAPQVNLSTDNPVCKSKKSQSRFAIKKAFRGKIKRSKSLHHLGDPDEDAKREKAAKNKSPIMRKINRWRLRRSNSMHNVSPSNETKTTESDESFSDKKSSRQTSQCDTQNPTQRYCEDTDASSDGLTDTDILPRRGSYHGENCSYVETSFEVNAPPTVSAIDGKSVSRFPVDLPLFYVPGSDAPTLRMRADDLRHSTDPDDNDKESCVRKSLFSAKKHSKQELFYKDIKPSTELCANSLSPPMNLYNNNLLLTAKQTSASTHAHGGLGVLTSTETFYEFRDRTKSSESEDSGCPNTSDII